MTRINTFDTTQISAMLGELRQTAMLQQAARDALRDDARWTAFLPDTPVKPLADFRRQALFSMLYVRCAKDLHYWRSMDIRPDLIAYYRGSARQNDGRDALNFLCSGHRAFSAPQFVGPHFEIEDTTMFIMNPGSE